MVTVFLTEGINQTSLCQKIVCVLCLRFNKNFFPPRYFHVHVKVLIRALNIAQQKRRTIEADVVEFLPGRTFFASDIHPSEIWGFSWYFTMFHPQNRTSWSLRGLHLHHHCTQNEKHISAQTRDWPRDLFMPDQFPGLNQFWTRRFGSLWCRWNEVSEHTLFVSWAHRNVSHVHPENSKQGSTINHLCRKAPRGGWQLKNKKRRRIEAKIPGVPGAFS